MSYTVLKSGVIGVDDWAFKKGKTYGTVIVDLERKEVIDLLPDREAGTLAEWLKKHPEIKTVSRDRYGPYALGVKTGAPHASQVADRFHLLVNLGEATFFYYYYYYLQLYPPNNRVSVCLSQTLLWAFASETIPPHTHRMRPTACSKFDL